MWPLVTSLRLRARAGGAKRSPTRGVVLAPGAQNDPHVLKGIYLGAGFPASAAFKLAGTATPKYVFLTGQLL